MFSNLLKLNEHTCKMFLFNQPIFLRLLLQIMTVPKSKLLGTVATVLLTNWISSHHPTNSVKALKDDSVPDCCHQAATMDQEHCNGCVDCLALWLQDNIPPVRMTMFLT